MNRDEIIIDYAILEVEDFVNWVKGFNIKLVEKVLGKNNNYKTTDVEKLFDMLDNDKKIDYQFSIDNAHNVAVAKHLGLLEPSVSMPTGEPEHLLKKSIKILEDASIKELSNPQIIMNFGLKDIENKIPTSLFKDDTDFSKVFNDKMKDDAIKNIDKIRYIMYFTDLDETPKPKK